MNVFYSALLITYGIVEAHVDPYFSSDQAYHLRLRV